MKNSLFRKGMVFGIIVLFVGISVIPMAGSLSMEKHISTASPYNVDLSCDDPYQNVRQGDTALFIVEITNTGTLDDTYDVIAGSIEDIVCKVNGVNADQFDPYPISLQAGGSTTFDVTAEVWESVPEGEWAVVVDAYSQNDTNVYDELTLIANVQKKNFVVNVVTDKTDYKRLEPVEVTISVTNNGDEDVTLEFGTTQEADFKVINEDGETVYLWSYRKLFNPIGMHVSIPSGETKILLQDEWNQLNNYFIPVPVGNYQIDGWMVRGINHPEIHGDPAPIKISRFIKNSVPQNSQEQSQYTDSSGSQQSSSMPNSQISGRGVAEVPNNNDILGNRPPYAPSNPIPEDGETDVPINEIFISWDGGDPDGDPVRYDVYFGESSPPPLVVYNEVATRYDPGIMDMYTTYYWQIVARDFFGSTTTGPIWNFTTGSRINRLPNAPEITAEKIGENIFLIKFKLTDPTGDNLKAFAVQWDKNQFGFVFDGNWPNGTIIEEFKGYGRGRHLITASCMDRYCKWGDDGYLEIELSKSKVQSSQQSSNPLFSQILQRLLNLR